MNSTICDKDQKNIVDIRLGFKDGKIMNLLLKRAKSMIANNLHDEEDESCFSRRLRGDSVEKIEKQLME